MVGRRLQGNFLEFEREIKDSRAVNQKMEVRRRESHPCVSSQKTREEVEKRNAGAAWEAQWEKPIFF